MKTIRYLIPLSALVVALFVIRWSGEDGPTPDSPQAGNPPRSTPDRQLSENTLAAKGMLWETMTNKARQRAVRSMTVAPGSFKEAVSGDVGSTVALRFSEKIPVLKADITNRKTETDGTVITNLSIPGTPEGHLTIQENASMDFFLAQLYYANHPIAYEFRKSPDGLTATRHELSSLLCSLIDHKASDVAHMGLPPVDKARGKNSDEENQAAIEKAKKGSVQEAKPGTGGGTTSLTLSIADASITEGNSGTKNLTFTVRLSKADRKKTITAAFSTANGTATAGSDYTAVSGTVTIAAGKNTATLNVPILGDTAVEPNETFFVNLSNPVNAVLSDGQAVGTIINDDSPPSSPPPVFNSLPGAVAVAYLDMDGQVVSGTSWANGGTITARGITGTFTNAQMLDICRRVAEDFSPFNINVTTEESVFLAAPSGRRTRCIITPDNEWFGTAGGVAYLNSFTWAGDTPCWVFSDQLANSPRYIAEASSHEIGHTLSLLHDGRTSPSEGYYTGHGEGEVGWAPIMGVGYYKLLVQWSKGEYLSANNKEDDLSRITTLNGFGYRADQVGNTISSATPLTGSSGARSASGIIETGPDVDVFSFSTTGGSCSFTALGDASSQNLDILLEILNSSGTVITSANPDTFTDATVSATLPAGNFFLRISGVGRGDVLAGGYSDYGSIGQYTISGNAP